VDRARKGDPVVHVLGDLGAPLIEGQPPTNPYLIDAKNAVQLVPEVE